MIFIKMNDVLYCRLVANFKLTRYVVWNAGIDMGTILLATRLTDQLSMYEL
jgi:hypothetical protein